MTKENIVKKDNTLANVISQALERSGMNNVYKDN